MSSILVLPVIFGFTALQVLAQTTTPPAAGGTKSTPPPVTTNPAPDVSPTQPKTSPTNQTSPANALFVSGKLMMDDGSTPPPHVAIQQVCAGITRIVAYADSKGRFDFRLGENSALFANASESSPAFGARGSVGRAGGPSAAGPGGPAGCELQASLAGYRSDRVNVRDGIILLHRLAKVEGALISATSLRAPAGAQKSYERGLQLVMDKKPAQAAKQFEKAVAAYPVYADAWLGLGKARLQQNLIAPAREAFLKAIDADPKLVAPYVELGLVSAGFQKWDDASQYLDHATRLDPADYPQAWYVSAVANFNLKKYDAAERSAREVIKRDPNHRYPRAEYLLALVLVEKSDYANAATHLKNYIDLAPDESDVAIAKNQLEKLNQRLAATSMAK